MVVSKTMLRGREKMMSGEIIKELFVDYTLNNFRYGGQNRDGPIVRNIGGCDW